MSSQQRCDFCAASADYRIVVEPLFGPNAEWRQSVCRPCLGKGVHLRPDMNVTLTPVRSSPGYLGTLAQRWRDQAATLHGRDEHDHGFCQLIEECASQLEASVKAEGTA